MDTNIERLIETISDSIKKKDEEIESLDYNVIEDGRKYMLVEGK